MSVALYRKHRPGTFAEVKGQEHATEPLQQALRNGRVHHAYLFSGPRGCGKTSSARILARSLNCVEGPTPEPCGECESCVALGPTGPGSVDVIEIDAASHGGVDDARDLRERAFFAPASSRYKVYVIDEAHMVTREGFNALLKLVEEPPPHLKFVFATTEPDKVIGTIRSRTHHYPFRLLPPSMLRELLADICAREGIEVEPAALPLVVRAGAGSVRDSLSILDQILAGAQAGQVTYAQAVGLLGYTDASLLDEVVEAFAAGEGAAVFEAVNRVVEGGHDPRRFAADLLERFRDLVVLRSVPDAGAKGLLDQPPDQLERMSAQSGRMGAAELSRAADLFHEGLTEMRGATSPRLLLELMCARVLLPGAGADEAALLARLDRVERRMSISGGAVPGHAEQPSANTDRPAPQPERPVPPPERSSPEPAQRSAPVREEPAEAQQANQSGTDASTQGWPEVLAPGSGQSAGATAGEREVSPADADPTPAPTGPSAPSPEPASQSVASGGLDVGAVRRAWPDVLEDVKNRRRVAWMILIGDVHVSDVNERALTLAFAKDGDRKGFMSSGCDRVLQESLQQVLGVHWEVRTTTGGTNASDAGYPPVDPAPAGPAPAGPAPAPRTTDPGSPVADPPGPTGPTEENGSPSDADDPSAAEAIADDPSPDGGAPSVPDDPRQEPGEAPGGLTDSDPSAVPPASASSPIEPVGSRELSGMALIQRELGAEVIEEIDDTGL